LWNNWTERLLRAAYSAVLYLLAPVTVYHLLWRGFRQQAYLERWNERYAYYPDDPASCSMRIWIHAVSVGEVNAVAPLVNALLERYPDARLLLTTITPTGSERVKVLWRQQVEHVYLPYDFSGAVRRFLAHFCPTIGLIMETELWPNLLFFCKDANIPTVVVNARLSENSLHGYFPLRSLVSRALCTVKLIAAQSETDAVRFGRLGAVAQRVFVTGNLKFDINIEYERIYNFARAFRARIGSRPVWIAASTHSDEEALVLSIHHRLRQRWPDLLLLWAPRHPERFRPAVQAAEHAGWQVATRTLAHWPDGGDAVFVLDTLGELLFFYACAEIAFVGGSLQPVGGHNLIEPAALEVPIVTGPHLYNFADISRRLQNVGAMKVGADTAVVGDLLEQLMADAGMRAAMGQAGKMLVDSGRGALTRTLEAIVPMLPQISEER